MRRVGARIRGLVPTFVSCVRTKQNIRLFYHMISHLEIKINKNNLNLSNSIKGFDIVLSVNVAFTRPIYNIKRCDPRVFSTYISLQKGVLPSEYVFCLSYGKKTRSD